MQKRNKAIFATVTASAFAVSGFQGSAALASDPTVDCSFAPGAIAVDDNVCQVSFTETPSGSWSVPNGVSAVDVLLVGGGGGGGSAYYSTTGGGAGEVRVHHIDLTSITALDVVVGNGGEQDQSGAPSRVTEGSSLWEAVGGEPGQSGDFLSFGGQPVLSDFNADIYRGGSSGNGFAGGHADVVSNWNGNMWALTVGGGGAGASEDGGTALDTRSSDGDVTPGNGGAGLTPTGGLFANNVDQFGGGGGGGVNADLGVALVGPYGVGGLGGGGNGSDGTNDGQDAVANTGGGGGGAGLSNFGSGFETRTAAGRGASGYVSIRFEGLAAKKLAATGSDSNLLANSAAALLAIGGVLLARTRRTRKN
ncbi:MAG: hypothetical protein RL556_100 [Actinomycetota bacterium]